MKEKLARQVAKAFEARKKKNENKKVCVSVQYTRKEVVSFLV